MRIWPDGDSVGLAAGLGHELAPECLPVFAEDFQRLGQVGPIRRQFDAAPVSAARAWPSASAEVSSPAVPTAPGCRQDVDRGPDQQVGIIDLDALEHDLGRA